jgi:hypothetical protein
VRMRSTTIRMVLTWSCEKPPWSDILLKRGFIFGYPC